MEPKLLLSLLLGLYVDVHDKSPSRNICKMMANENCVALYCVDPRLEQYICSMFVSNYFVFRQKISQQAILITVVIETP